MHRVRFRDPGGATRIGTWKGSEVQFADRVLPLAEVDILAPSAPSKVIGVGMNYEDHIQDLDVEAPERPLLFLIAPNAIAGHGDTVSLPTASATVEFEGEIGVVIGTQCRNVTPDAANQVIAGYTCVNDISNREDQMQALSGTMDLFRGKAFDYSTVIGPVIATPNEVPPDATIEVHQNGEIKQRSSLDQLLFDIPTLIAEITAVVTLEEGDVITTGSTGGSGQLGHGDTIEITIEGVGTLRHSVESIARAEPPDRRGKDEPHPSAER